MNNDKKRTFIRSNSFNLRLNYDKKANSNNKIIIEQQLKSKYILSQKGQKTQILCLLRKKLKYRKKKITLSI